MGLFDWIKKPEPPATDSLFKQEMDRFESDGTIARLATDCESRKPYLVLRSDGSKSQGRIEGVRNPLVDLAFVDEKDGVEKHKTIGIRDFLSWQ